MTQSSYHISIIHPVAAPEKYSITLWTHKEKLFKHKVAKYIIDENISCEVPTKVPV